MAIDPVTGVDDGVLPPTTQPVATPAPTPAAPVGGVMPPMETGVTAPPPAPIGATGLGEIEAARPPGSTTGQYITPQATVSGQLLDLLGKDSPYLREADTRAREESNRMGLLGSSMAVGASERERIKAALPIAQQDADLYGRTALKDQEFAGDSALMTQGHTENIEALGVQGDIQLRLEAYSQDAATQRSQMEMEFKANIANVEMDGQIRQQYIQSASDLGNQYNSDVGAILRSKDFGSEVDRRVALDQIEQVYTNNLDFLSSASGVDLTWTTSGGTTTTGDGVIPAPATTVPDVFTKESGNADTDYFSNAMNSVPYGGGMSGDWPKFEADFAKTEPYSSPSYLEFYDSPKVAELPDAFKESIYQGVMGGALNPDNKTLVDNAIQTLHPEQHGGPYNGANIYSKVEPATSVFQQFINDNL